MLAIKSLYVALASIQTERGNPYPRIAILIGLAGQLIVPVFSVFDRYASHVSRGVALLVAGLLSLFVINIVVRSLPEKNLLFIVNTALKVKVFACLLIPTLFFVFVARKSPEASIFLYFLYSILPLKSLLRFQADADR